MSRTAVKVVALVVLVGFVGALVGGWMVFGPNTPSFEGKRGVKIPPQSTFDAVLDSLDGVLARPGTFALLAGATGWRDQVKAGYYEFEAGVSNYEVIDRIRKGKQSYVRVTIPPGTRTERIAAVAGRELAAGPERFQAALESDSLARALGVAPGQLFGYMLPETYFFYWLTPPERVIGKIKGDFDSFLEQHGPSPDSLTPAEVATVASIVEWETAVEEEKARVAGVYLNRLRIGMPLQADPTVQYGLQEIEGQKRRLFFADYRLSHPYNTYLYRGLPPGPITNPSPSSIRAVLAPESHDYLYFVAKGDGSHVFSRTLAEHNRAAQRFYDLMRERRAASQNGTG